MKTFHFYSISRTLVIACLFAYVQKLYAQVADSSHVDTLSSGQTEISRPAAPQPRPLLLGKVRTSKILPLMPQYQAIQRNMDAMRAQYEAEARNSENDFQRKFEEFMQGYKEFPKTIMEKRHNELNQMLEANVAFRVKVQKLLKEAEESMLSDVKAELNDAINIIAEEYGISIVFDVDGGSVPYIMNGISLDITDRVLEYLTGSEVSSAE